MTQALVLQLHLDSVIARANGQSSNRSLPLLLPGRGAETAFSIRNGFFEGALRQVSGLGFRD